MANVRKVQKKSGFLLYAQEFSHQNRLSLPFDELADIVSVHWDNMTEENKKVYKVRARNDNGGPSTSSFNPNNQALIEAQSRRFKHEMIMEEVRILVQNAYDTNSLHTTVFTMFSANSFNEDKEDIFPAELAVSLFCLQEGVFKSFHTRINPGPLPLFARYDAQKRSDTAFKYPIPSNDIEGDDYIDILVKLIKFIQPRKLFPTIFFTDGNLKDDYDRLDINERVMKKILDEAGEYDVSASLKIYPMKYLLYFLKFFVTKEKEGTAFEGMAFDSLKSAEEALQREQIEYEHSTDSCEFHDMVDAKNHCCLSKTRRFGYILAKLCADQNKYVLKEGNHYPNGFQLELPERFVEPEILENNPVQEAAKTSKKRKVMPCDTMDLGEDRKADFIIMNSAEIYLEAKGKIMKRPGHPGFICQVCTKEVKQLLEAYVHILKDHLKSGDADGEWRKLVDKLMRNVEQICPACKDPLSKAAAQKQANRQHLSDCARANVAVMQKFLVDKKKEKETEARE